VPLAKSEFMIRSLSILYHHRTGATDAQRIHILEITHALRAQGHQVHFVALVDPEESHQPAYEAKSPGRIRQFIAAIRGNPLVFDLIQIAYNAYAIPRLLLAARRLKADGLYERHALFNVSSAVAARLLGLPLVIEVNSPLAMEQEREGAIRLKRLGLWMERWSLNRATRVIAVTSPLKSILVGMGVQSSLITVMPNGIDPARFSQPASRPDLPATAGKTVIGFVGWFREWHGLDRLIDAVAEIGLAQRNGLLMLIGDGPARASLEQQVKRLGLEQTVLITGALPHEKVPEYLACVDIAVQPAANEYCCPMKIIEYMGMSKAIVAPNQPNIAELFADGSEGLLFDRQNPQSMAQALARLLDDPGLRSRLAAGARARIDRSGYLWPENARKVAEILSNHGRNASV
jgi:glycosyltransferase involved in cell wall biosynthesis